MSKLMITLLLVKRVKIYRTVKGCKKHELGQVQIQPFYHIIPEVSELKIKAQKFTSLSVHTWAIKYTHLYNSLHLCIQPSILYYAMVLVQYLDHRKHICHYVT